MVKDSEIKNIIVDGLEKTALSLGHKDDSIISQFFKGEKRDSLLVKDGKVERVKYGAIYYEGETRYVYFDKMELYSLEHLFTTHRSKALEIVRNIAIALESADEEFLDLLSGVFPLYRIFIYEDSGVFLLSEDISDVVGLLRREDEKISEVNALIRRNTEDNFRLILEMGELLYYAATGSLPYESRDVRLYKYEEFPLSSALSYLGDTLDEKTAGFINFILHAKTQEMRDIMGNRSPSIALSWFIKRTEDLSWNLEEKKVDDTKLYTESEEYSSYLKRAFSGAKRATFFRKRGTILAIILIVVLFVGAISYDFISRALEPPTTAGLDQEDVIYSFYNDQSNLNADGMMSAVKGADIPQESEVTNMYVTSRVRMAYEQINPAVNVNTWYEENQPDLITGAIIYGVRDIELERVDEDTIIAHVKWYTPYAEDGRTVNDGTDTTNPSYTTVFVYDVDQRFDFTWNKRGWWNITGSEIEKFELSESFTLNYVETDHTPLMI